MAHCPDHDKALKALYSLRRLANRMLIEAGHTPFDQEINDVTTDALTVVSYIFALEARQQKLYAALWQVRHATNILADDNQPQS
jgi:hypothetical protein